MELVKQLDILLLSIYYVLVFKEVRQGKTKGLQGAGLAITAKMESD